MAIVFVLFMLFFFCLILLSSAFWIWMIIDCINNKFLTDTSKAIWVLVIVFTHFIGALCYLLAGRKSTSTYPSPQGLPFQQANAMHPPRPAPIPQPPYNRSYPAQGQSIPYPHQPAIQQTYDTYQQGYQPPLQGMPPAAQESWRRDDEPQATYPELPRQELSQQSNND